MPYRNIEPQSIETQRREISVTSTHSLFKVTNGTITYVAVPCFYVEVLPPIEARPHCRDHHDHIGWPSPAHPDHICQAWDFSRGCCMRDPHKLHCPGHCEHFIDMGRCIPIHLVDEGYDTCRMVLVDDALHGLDVECWFDPRQDWIIRCKICANMPSAATTHKTIPFSIFVDGAFDGREVTSIVQRGHILVMPAII